MRVLSAFVIAGALLAATLSGALAEKKWYTGYCQCSGEPPGESFYKKVCVADCARAWAACINTYRSRCKPPKMEKRLCVFGAGC